jgi:hypothetical protein
MLRSDPVEGKLPVRKTDFVDITIEEDAATVSATDVEILASIRRFASHTILLEGAETDLRAIHIECHSGGIQGPIPRQDDVLPGIHSKSTGHRVDLMLGGGGRIL